MFGLRSTRDSAIGKVARYGLGLAHNIWANSSLVVLAVLLGSVGAAVAVGVGGIRFFFLLYFAVALVLSYRFRSLFLGFFLTFVFTLQFVHPNKLYSIEVIRGSEILERIYNEGYSIAYFFHVASFFAIFVTGVIASRLYHDRHRLPRAGWWVLGIVAATWLAFSLIAGYGITRFSPYSFLSAVWLFQYGLMYLVAIGTLVGLMLAPGFRRQFFRTLAAIVITQFVVSLLQLIFQRSVGLPFEATSFGSFATGLDENNAVFRVMGSFMFSNQLAYVQGILLAILLPYALERKSLFFAVVTVLALITIVLSQSRSVMIGSVLILLINLRFHLSGLLALIARIGGKRLTFLFLAAFLLTAFSLIPRLILSVNTAHAGAGLAIRVRMFREAGEAILTSPWVGYGIGTNEYVLHKLFPDGVMSVFPAVVHMAYLQLWLEVGIIGLFVLLAPFIFLLRFVVAVPARQGSVSAYRWSYFNGLVITLIFWTFLPHIGIIEFPFLGLVLGCGAFWYYLSLTTAKKGADA